MMNAKQIRRDRIVPDPDQPRKSFPQESLDELAVSLKARARRMTGCPLRHRRY